MTVTKCDICKRVIKKGDMEFALTMLARPGLFGNATVCLTCGKPVHEMFKKHNLGDYKKALTRHEKLSVA